MAQATTNQRLALMSGGIAFFTVLALAPTFFAFGAIASVFISRDDLEAVLKTILNQAPNDVASSLVPGIVSIASQGSSAALTTSSIVAIFVAVYAASKVVLGLRLALDSIFHVAHVPSGLVNRAFAGLVAFIGLIGFAVIAAALTIIPRLLDLFGLVKVPSLVHVLIWLIGIPLLYLALRAFYRHGPQWSRADRINVPWWSWPVTFATGWIVIVTVSFGLYVSHSGALGAAIALFGASVVFLVWLYFIVLGVLLGAQMLALSDHQATEAVQQPKP
jgi:membrane protein